MIRFYLHVHFIHRARYVNLHVNLLLKVKQQRRNRQDRQSVPWKKWPKKVHKGIKSLSSNPIPPIFCFQWRYWVSFSAGESECLICGWAAVSWRGAANTIELWKALRSAHALSKDVWHLAPDSNLKEEKQENHIEFDTSIWWNLSLKGKCAVSAPLAASNELEQLKLKWCFPMQNWQTKIPVCCTRLQGEVLVWLQYNASLRQLQCLHSKQ